MMASDKFQKRIKALFNDMDQLEAKPGAEMPGVRDELDALRARLVELEAQVSQSKPLVAPPPEPALPVAQPAPEVVVDTSIIYEKEQVGYVFAQEQLHKADLAVLQEIDVEKSLVAPLVAGDQPIGAVAIEGGEDHAWNPEDSNLAEAVARQVSLQVQNLRLLAAAERARSEAQAATRRYAHESWESFLDAIHQSERIGYAYDLASVEPFAEPVADEVDVFETVSVLEEQVGHLLLNSDPERPLGSEDRAFVAAVARQLGQQVENLRLLADASRARAEAEEATRRLTRQSWQDYLASQLERESLAFVYDQNRVTTLSAPLSEESYSQPLTVRGEPIGELVVAGGSSLSTEEAELVAAIAAQASTHLEALRLTEELQKRAAELQELDRLKSSFLANMSHELRTPLNSILGFSDVMLEGIDGDLTPYMENDLKLIQKNGKHLLHLINDVLDMAKIESGRMNLHPERFKVNEVFEDVFSITSSLANEKHLTLEIEPDSDTEVEIFADLTRIKQVLINLVNNSIKFTEKGGITVHSKKINADLIMIKVKDTGLGIPASHLETIFQEFAQVDTSTTRKVGGTGLGLPISRRLVEMHGGRMWAESTGIPGEGTTLFVELPVEARITETIEKRAK